MVNLSQRMTALEGDMADMRQEWQRQERVPAAQTRLLNAMRQTQVEQGQDISQLKTDMSVVKLALIGLDHKVNGLDQKVNGLDQKVNGLDQRLAVVEDKLVNLGHGMGTITAMLTTLIEREPPSGT